LTELLSARFKCKVDVCGNYNKKTQISSEGKRFDSQRSDIEIYWETLSVLPNAEKMARKFKFYTALRFRICFTAHIRPPFSNVLRQERLKFVTNIFWQNPNFLFTNLQLSR